MLPNNFIQFHVINNHLFQFYVKADIHLYIVQLTIQKLKDQFLLSRIPPTDPCADRRTP